MNKVIKLAARIESLIEFARIPIRHGVWGEIGAPSMAKILKKKYINVSNKKTEAMLQNQSDRLKYAAGMRGRRLAIKEQREWAAQASAGSIAKRGQEIRRSDSKALRADALGNIIRNYFTR